MTFTDFRPNLPLAPKPEDHSHLCLLVTAEVKQQLLQPLTVALQDLKAERHHKII